MDGGDAPLGDGTALLSNPELLRLGPEALVYQLLDIIVDGYFPVLDGLQTDKEQIERQVFSGDAAAAERIYRLSEEVIDPAHATTALSKVLRRLQVGAKKYPAARRAAHLPTGSGRPSRPRDRRDRRTARRTVADPQRQRHAGCAAPERARHYRL